MMKLFKKKKSDNKLSTTMLQQQKSFESPITSTSTSTVKKPVPAIPNTAETIAVATANRPYTPPAIVMPKPRKLLTPTRAILGRFDCDKTQVEEEEEEQEPVAQEIISPILLPTPHHEEAILQPHIVKPVATTKSGPLQQLSSVSTAGSDDSSSRVYESALESLPGDDEDDDRTLNLPSFSFIKKQQAQTVDSGILSASSSRTASPNKRQSQPRVAVRGPSSTSSATITSPHNKQQSPPQPQPPVMISLQKQKEEQEILLQHLKKQVELMEKQRILDREEWSKKEQELLNHRHQMMETLIETKYQLTNVLKSREEKKAREIYYQKQLQQQQLEQLQQVALQHQQQQEEKGPVVEEEEEEVEDLGGYCPPQDMQQQPRHILQQQHIVDDPQELEDDNSNRRVIKIRSEEYLGFYNSRCSSRSSNNYHYQPQQPEMIEDTGRRSISRRNSNASNKSNRFDPSPATTIVATTPMMTRRMRPRARSIECGKWHEEQIMYDMMDPPQPQQYYVRPRRSRSVGKSVTQRRPLSRSSMVYANDYCQDVGNYDLYDVYYDNRYNNNRFDNTRPPPRPKQQLRYNNDEYYVQQQPYYASDYYSPHHQFPPPHQPFHQPMVPATARQQSARYGPRHYTYN